MQGSKLRRALAQGERVFGLTLTGYGQPTWPATVAELGLDFVFIDSEHTPLNRETIAWACQAYAANGVAPLLRIPEPSPVPAAIGRDLGAHGIIVPYVETVEQVKALVGAVKYRPLKGAALHAALDDGEFPNPETKDYLEAYNAEAVLIIMIESPAGVANLPDMLVGGVDAVLVGPHDLSVSHGMPEQYDDPRFEAILRHTAHAARERGIGAGIYLISADLARALRWANLGYNMIVYGADVMLISEQIKHGLGRLRRSLDTAPGQPRSTS